MAIQGRWMLAFSMLFMAVYSSASIITVEPDDYGSGADLSHVSPYVSIQWVYGTTRAPILATPTQYGSPAPTGDLTFGYHPFGFTPDPPGSSDLDNRMGLGFFFNQPTDHVSLLTLSDGYPYLGVEWGAFDQYGNLIEYGWVNGGAPTEAVLADIYVDGMWTLLIGGHDSIAGVSFDHLVFEVPEPGALPLFVLGVLVVIWNANRGRLSGTKKAGEKLQPLKLVARGGIIASAFGRRPCGLRREAARWWSLCDRSNRERFWHYPSQPNKNARTGRAFFVW